MGKTNVYKAVQLDEAYFCDNRDNQNGLDPEKRRR